MKQREELDAREWDAQKLQTWASSSPA